jgi:hypothetical protein
MVLNMVSQPAMTKQMAVCARSVQLMVENMVSQPARTKEMAVCVQKGMEICWTKPHIFYIKKNLWLKLPPLSPSLPCSLLQPGLGWN